MANFYIGLSGLQVAQAAIETIGTNITNAATEGYHRQEVIIAPMPMDYLKHGVSSGGAEIKDIVRKMDMLLENEMLRQLPGLGQNEQELATLRTLEAALGDLDEEGIGASINDFFNSIKELSAQPNSQAHLEQVVWTGEAMASLFRNISSFITGLRNNIRLEAIDVTTQMNNLLGKIADYNEKIHGTSVTGGNINLLSDQRDGAIEELGRLLPVQTLQQGMDSGMVNVEGWGIPLVVRTDTTPLVVNVVAGDDRMGVSVQGADHYDTSVTGGKIGALLNLYNEIIPGIEDKFNALASQIIEQINELHVQGVSGAGSFSELTGWRVENGAFDTWSSAVEAGDLYVRVTDTATGQVSRHLVMTVDPAVHTVQDVVDAFNAIAPATHVNASNNSGALHLYADNGFKFDFVPAVSTTPDTSAITGSADAAFSGVYDGDANETYTFTVHGSGDVSSSADLYLEVQNSAAQIVATINIGRGYATGDRVLFDNGLSVAIGPGTLNNGDTFTLNALTETDASGALAALGVNAFFTGTNANTIQVVQRLVDQPGLVAGAIGPEMSDNANLLRMAAMGDQRLGGLENLAINDFYRRLLTDIGHEVATHEARQTALETVQKQMITQRDVISGVDVNEEAAKLLMFEQMFQAVSRFITTQNRALQELMDII